MYYLVPPCLRRLFNVLPIGGLLLFLSCKSEPPVFNPSGGYEYQFHSFPLDIESSRSFQIVPNIGTSSKLYTGIITTHDTVYAVHTLIRLLPDIISDHEVCDADSIESVSISISTLDTIATQDIDDSFLPRFDVANLNIYSIKFDLGWSEESNIDTMSAVKILNDAPIEGSILSFSYLYKELIIEYPADNTISNQNQWCIDSGDLGLLISYLPDTSNIDEDILRFIEFYSSENTDFKKPKINFSYKTIGDTTFVENRYAISSVSLGSNPADLTEPPYMITDPDSLNWGRIFAFNLPPGDPPVLSNYFEPIDVELDPIISETQTNSELELIEITITRNGSDFNEVDSIELWLDNAAAYTSDEDPAGDNYNDVSFWADLGRTEGNGVFDWDDIDEDGLVNYYIDRAEIFYDYGLDQCVDSLECGDNMCMDNADCVSPYNPNGTAGNGILNWTDIDGDGIYSSGDSGEPWWDWGLDWCPDSLENGEGLCLADTVATGPAPCNCDTTANLEYEYDPNLDNFDPVGDDWNHGGKEGNQQWDLGEPFNDWGSDGVPSAFAGYSDAGEGNGQYDDGEPFYDTGLDGKYNVDEVENYSSTSRTEGNFNPSGERYLDCGEDTDYSTRPPPHPSGDKDAWGCLDSVNVEFFNIDPNEDNWSQDNEDDGRTEGNRVWDYENLNEDGEITEDYDDWGYDHLPDAQEAFLYSQVLIPADDGLILWPDGDEKFSFSVTAADPINEKPQPNADLGIAEIWISDIHSPDPNANPVQWEIVISVNTPVALTGFQFKLKHTPLTSDSTRLLSYQASEFQIGVDKLYQDITLLPNVVIPNIETLNDNLMINYSNSLVALLDFTGLKDTLEKWEDLIFSKEYSNLVLYIDETIVLEEDMSLIMKNYPVDNSVIINDYAAINIQIETDADSVVIPMGIIMQYFEYGTFGDYMGVYLESEGTSYNYDQIQFIYDPSNDQNSRLDLMYRR